MLQDIEIKLNTNYLDNRYYFDSVAKKIIYSGSIDEFYNYRYGVLEYRTLKFEEEILNILNIPNFQGNAVVNYTDNEIPYTRIIEHKLFQFGKDVKGNDLPTTVITKEYALNWQLNQERYYPINDEKNNCLYDKYKQLAQTEKNVIFGGKLGEYKYYNMDEVISSSLKLCNKELSKT